MISYRLYKKKITEIHSSKNTSQNYSTREEIYGSKSSYDSTIQRWFHSIWIWIFVLLILISYFFKAEFDKYIDFKKFKYFEGYLIDYNQQYNMYLKAGIGCKLNEISFSLLFNHSYLILFLSVLSRLACSELCRGSRRCRELFQRQIKLHSGHHRCNQLAVPVHILMRSISVHFSARQRKEKKFLFKFLKIFLNNFFPWTNEDIDLQEQNFGLGVHHALVCK